MRTNTPSSPNAVRNLRQTNRGRLGHLGPLLRPSKRLLTAAAAAVVDHLQDSLLRRFPLGHPVRLQCVVCDEQVFSVHAGRARKHKRWAAQPSWAVVGDCCRGRARHRGNAKLEQLRKSRNSRYRAGTTLSQNGYERRVRRQNKKSAARSRPPPRTSTQQFWHDFGISS